LTALAANIETVCVFWCRLVVDSLTDRRIISRNKKARRPSWNPRRVIDLQGLAGRPTLQDCSQASQQGGA